MSYLDNSQMSMHLPTAGMMPPGPGSRERSRSRDRPGGARQRQRSLNGHGGGPGGGSVSNGTNLRVVVRVRPPLERELENPNFRTVCATQLGSNEVRCMEIVSYCDDISLDSSCCRDDSLSFSVLGYLY